jgi:hypothetical protein
MKLYRVLVEGHSNPIRVKVGPSGSTAQQPQLWSAWSHCSPNGAEFGHARVVAISGGLTKREDGQQVLHIYVDAQDVKLLLERADGRHYNSYSGDDLELDVPVHGAPVAEVHLCVVPDDPDWPS